MAAKTVNSIFELLTANLRRNAQKVVYRCGGRSLTFEELLMASRGFAALLQEEGIKPGDRVAIRLGDSLSFPVAFLGCLLHGAVAVVVAASSSTEDLMDIIDRYGPLLLVTQNGLVSSGTSVNPGIRTICCDDSRLLLDRGNSSAPPSAYGATVDDIAYVLFTSGSTGRPKGVPHRLVDLVLPCELVGKKCLGVRESDVIYSTSKLSFSYGLINSLALPIFFGATAILHPGRPDPEAVMEIIRRDKPSVFFSVPSIYARLLLSATEERQTFPMRLCCSAGEALSPSIFHEWQRLTGLEILDGYGLTESSYHVICNSPGEAVPGSAGRVVPGYRARLVDEEGNDVPRGKEGRLVIEGETISQPIQGGTAESNGEGCLHTNDIFMERDGFYFHRGRLDDMIKVDALWVLPQLVEEALCRHHAVAECAIVPVPVGPFVRPGAFVVPKSGIEGNKLLAEELKEYVRPILPEHMRPARYRFVNELPRTSTGKIQRSRLSDKQNVS